MSGFYKNTVVTNNVFLKDENHKYYNINDTIKDLKDEISKIKSDSDEPPPPPWGGKCYSIRVNIWETSKYNRWNETEKSIYESPLSAALTDGIFLDVTYQFTADGKKLLRHVGTSPISFDDITEKSFVNNKVVPFKIEGDEEVPLYSHGTGKVYKSSSYLEYPDGKISAPYYRAPGFYFTDNYNTLHYRYDPDAHYHNDLGLEFFYSSAETDSLIGKLVDEFDMWIRDPVAYASDGVAVLKYDDNFTKNTPLADELIEQNNMEIMTVVNDPRPNQKKTILEFVNKPEKP